MHKAIFLNSTSYEINRYMSQLTSQNDFELIAYICLRHQTTIDHEDSNTSRLKFPEWSTLAYVILWEYF